MLCSLRGIGEKDGRGERGEEEDEEEEETVVSSYTFV